MNTLICFLPQAARPPPLLRDGRSAWLVGNGLSARLCNTALQHGSAPSLRDTLLAGVVVVTVFVGALKAGYTISITKKIGGRAVN